MFPYLPRRDDVAGLVSPGVDDEIKNAAGFSQRLNALLAVVLATVDQFDDLRIIEDADCLREIDLAGLPFSSRFFSSQLNFMIPQGAYFVYTIYCRKFKSGLRP